MIQVELNIVLKLIQLSTSLDHKYSTESFITTFLIFTMSYMCMLLNKKGLISDGDRVYFPFNSKI